MSMRTMACSSSNSDFGERFAQLGFADAGGAAEDERADRAVRILQAAAAAADGVGDGPDRFVLADDALVQPLFEHEQLGPFFFEHAGDGNAGPGAHDLGDFVGADFLAKQAATGRLAVGLVAGGLLGRGFFEVLGELLLLVVELVELLVRGFVDVAGRLLLFDLGELLVVANAGFVHAGAARRPRRPGPSFRLPTARGGWRASCAARPSPL